MPVSATLRLLAALVLAAAAAPAQTPLYLDARAPVQARLDDLMKRMTLDEKIGQLVHLRGMAEVKERSEFLARVEFLDRELTRAVSRDELAAAIVGGRVGSLLQVSGLKEANVLQKLALESRLKIPLLIATDAIHGNGYTRDEATIFPTPLAMTSSFDEDLLRRVARATAREMRAVGYQWNFSPYPAVSRDARWGRIAETFGEDPLVNARMAVAMVRGYQEGGPKRFCVAACPKVWVGEGQPHWNGLNHSPLETSERDLYTTFLPPFKAAFDAGAYTTMAAHHEIGGVPCHANVKLNRGLLKGEWGFRGPIISDWNDVDRLATRHHIARDLHEATELALEAGIDVFMLGERYFGVIKDLVESGRVPVSMIDEAARRVLWVKFQLGLFEDRFFDEAESRDIVRSREHLDLALEAARKSIVLLKNEGGLLPLSTRYRRILVSGPNADHPAQLGDWVLGNHEKNAVTVLEGMRHVAPAGVEIVHSPCGDALELNEDDIRRAVAKAASCDAVVAVVGSISLRSYRGRAFCGENRDRSTLGLYGRQLELIQALHSTGKPVIVVLVNGRPLAIKWCAENVPAIVNAWETGEMAGAAVAEVLFGKVNPSGKLPVSFPSAAGQPYCYYNRKPTALIVDFKDEKFRVLYPFGHGLSYTEFRYGNLRAARRLRPGETLRVEVDVTNAGGRPGEEVVLVYVNDVVSGVTTPVKELKAFTRVALEPGQTKTVALEIPYRSLGLYNADMKWVVEPGEFQLMVGGLERTFEVVP